MAYHSSFCLQHRCSNCGDPACACYCHRARNIGHFIETINLHGRGLSEWEKNTFMPSVTAQWEREHWMSQRQEEIIKRIYDEKTP